MRSCWVVLIAVSVAACSFSIRKSRAELQADLEQRFPLRVDKQVAALELTDPELDFPAGTGRLGLACAFAATLPTGVVRGHARVEGVPEYRRAEQAFFLREATVTGVEMATGDRDPVSLLDGSLVRRAVETAVGLAFASLPVYRLDASRGEQEAKAISHLESVRVDGQELVITVGW